MVWRKIPTFSGHLSWLGNIVIMYDFLILENTIIDISEEVADANVTDQNLFVLTDLYLYRLDLSNLRTFRLCLQDIASGWEITQFLGKRLPLEKTSISLFNHFGLHAETFVPSKSSSAAFSCTDSDVFLVIKKAPSRLYKVFSNSDSFSTCQLLQLNSAEIVDIRCGKAHTLLLDADGKVLVFGTGSRGELGLGELASESQPMLIPAFDGNAKIVQISAGGWHSAAVTAEGDLYLWGWNDCGQLAIPPNEVRIINVEFPVFFQCGTVTMPHPVDFPDGFTVQQVSCGARHTVFLNHLNEAFGCGNNDRQQLGSKTDCKLPYTKLRSDICHVYASNWTTVLYSAD